MRYLVAAALLFASPAFAKGEPDAEHLFEIAGLEILHPWTNATQDNHAFVYMEIHNEGADPVEIIGARLVDGPQGYLVGFRMQGGKMGIASLPPIPVAPGKHLDLTPRDLAIRLDGLAAPLVAGQSLKAVLLTSAGELEIDVAIESMSATRHSHSGHSH